MLSVIIPTYNAAEQLPRTLAALVPAVITGLLSQVIIADGGSTDETQTLSEMSGAVFLNLDKGRGIQLASGAKATKSEWLLFLHADTQLSPGWESEVQHFIEGQMMSGQPPRAAYFTYSLDDPGVFARIMEIGVRIRSSLFALPYGDQGLLIEKNFYNRIGGYSSLPLMEDVEFVRRIGRKRLGALSSTALTSAQRYRRDGYGLRIMRNLSCLALYFLRVPPAKIAKLYR